MGAKWIVVSGLDGSGKTTLLDNLEEHLQKQGYRVMRDRLPHDKYLVKTLLPDSHSAYTDRLLFALDNRIFAEHFNEWQQSGEYDYIITQRGFLDSFVHGRVQGYSYGDIAILNKIADLPKCDYIIHLVAEAEVAYKRIKDDPDADKFEYLDYIRVQEYETRRAYSEVLKKNMDLMHFHDAINVYIDTTEMSTDETFEYALKKLRKFEEI